MASSLERTFNCPVELALEVLGGKWKVVMLARLKEGPLRYAELRGESARPTLQALYDWGLRLADEVGARIESPRPPPRRNTA